VEFMSPHTDESSYGSKVESIEKVAPPVSYAPTYHIQVLDSHGVKRVLDDHGDQIARHLQRIHGDWMERAGIV
jgi:hypothetical protein